MAVSLVRSTPLRITLILGGVFVAAMLLSGVVAWQLVSRELANRLDESIREDFAVISQTFGDGDVTDLRDSVASHASATAAYRQVYLLRSPDDGVLAGNIKVARAPLGWSLVPAADLGLAGGTPYRVFSSAVGGNPLLVGASLKETEEVGSIVLTSLTSAAALLTGILLALGALLANRGRRRLAEIRIVMERVGEGQLDARLPVSRRRDDIDSVAEQVNRALERLATQVESLRQVSVDIAHDLKTPLNRLAIAVATAVSAAAGDSDIEQRLIEAEQEIDHMNATFEALLRIAQIEAGSRRARFLPIQIGPLLSQLGELYADVAEENRQHLSFDIAEELEPVQGDRELLTQLIANLTENAIRHCPPGALISIDAYGSATGQVLAVCDNGPGIPGAEREAVFRRLYRLERSRTSPGTGLGLSLVKAIATLHDATVVLEDNNPGLRVVVRFPILDKGGARAGGGDIYKSV